MVCNKAMDIERIQSLFVDSTYQPSKQDILSVIEDLKNDYADRGLQLVEVKSGFRFQTRQEVADWVNHLWEEKPARYSRATLETLALVAYRQPITRSEIEDVRGVSVSTNIIRTLEERNWIRVVGHKDLPGRPAMFATTKQFLDDFNLSGLEDLPSLMDVRDLDKIQHELFGDEMDASDTPQEEMASTESPTLNELSDDNQSEDRQSDVDQIENDRVVEAAIEAVEAEMDVAHDQSDNDKEAVSEEELDAVLQFLEGVEDDAIQANEQPSTQAQSFTDAEPSSEELAQIEFGTESEEEKPGLYKDLSANASEGEEEIERAIDEVFEHFDDDEVVEFKELDFVMPEFHMPAELDEEKSLKDSSEDLTQHGFQEMDNLEENADSEESDSPNQARDTQTEK